MVEDDIENAVATTPAGLIAQIEFMSDSDFDFGEDGCNRLIAGVRNIAGMHRAETFESGWRSP